MKPGDKVVCVDSSRSGKFLVKGGEYTVACLSSSGEDLVLKEIEDIGYWRTSRFVLANTDSSAAKKEDDNKTRWDIIMQIPGLTTVAEVFTFGAKKYDAFNWRKSKGNEQYKFRLLAAAMRHISKRFLGEKLDPETQKPHLAHAIADLLMVLDLEA